MNPEGDHYLSFLLRLWRVRGEAWDWRASLEDPINGEIQGFPDKQSLYAFIEEKTKPPNMKLFEGIDQDVGNEDEEKGN